MCERKEDENSMIICELCRHEGNYTDNNGDDMWCMLRSEPPDYDCDEFLINPESLVGAINELRSDNKEGADD